MGRRSAGASPASSKHATSPASSKQASKNGTPSPSPKLGPLPSSTSKPSPAPLPELLRSGPRSGSREPSAAEPPPLDLDQAGELPDTAGTPPTPAPPPDGVVQTRASLPRAETWPGGSRRYSSPADLCSLLHANPRMPAQPFMSFLAGQLGLHHDEPESGEDNSLENDLRREGIYNFLSVPRSIEPMLVFGYITCLDCFVNQFTFLPMRVARSLVMVLLGRRLTPQQSCELLRGCLIVAVSYVLLSIDMSHAYHTVRNQATIKLYVIFNMLEIFDKLCASFGQDILETLYAQTLHRRAWRGGMLVDFGIALLYVTAHTVVLFYHGVALTCAVNSNNNVLLTLLISNNFVELKSNVFKKCEVPNLFQISCSDMVERFQLSIYIFFVVLQYVKVGGGGFENPWDLGLSLLLIATAELVVDWVKHAFVIKFNHISPAVYSRFTYILCSGMSPALQQHAGQQPTRKLASDVYHEGSGAVCARMGFVPIPLLCLFVRIVGHDVYPSLDMAHPSGWLLCLLIWLAFCTLKVLTSMSLLGYACRRVEQCSAELSRDGRPFLEGVERFSLCGKRVA